MLKNKKKLLELKNIKKYYNSNYVLRDINLIIPGKTKIGLIGENGAGKTTLLKILAGLLNYNGEYIIEDQIASFEIIRKFLFPIFPPENSLYHKLTLIENINFFSSIFHSDKSLSELLISKFKFKTQLAYKYKELSHGNKIKALLLIALLKPAKLLLLDEPFNGIDPKMLKDITNIINENFNNQAMIISSHILQPLFDICEVFIFLKNGKILIKTKEQLQKSNNKVFIKIKSIPQQIKDDINWINDKEFWKSFDDFDEIINWIYSFKQHNKNIIESIKFEHEKLEDLL